MLSVALPQPEPIGPYADILAAKAAGVPPYVTRCPVTGLITDTVLGRTLTSSVAYRAAQGHQKHTPEAPVSKREGRMREWAGIRKAGDAWKPLKITQGKLAQAHGEFLKGALEMSDLVACIFTFLEQKGFTDDHIVGFISAAFDDAEALKRYSSSVLASSLLVRCRAFVADSPVEKIIMNAEEPEEGDPEPAESHQDDDEPLEGSAPCAAAPASKGRHRRAIEAAFGQYVAEAPDAMDNLFKIILEFATAKQRGVLFDKHEVSATHDDWAQAIALDVFEALPKFVGGPSSFYAWVNRITYTTGITAATEANAADKKFMQTTVTDQFGVSIDNPKMYGAALPMPYRRALPEFITGVNLKICNWIRSGYDYAEIAKILELTTGNVEDRVRSMRKKIKAQKANS